MVGWHDSFLGFAHRVLHYFMVDFRVELDGVAPQYRHGRSEEAFENNDETEQIFG